MSRLSRYFFAVLFLSLVPAVSHAQVGFISGGANNQLSCTVITAGTPLLRREGYAEATGDILISCSGGAALAPGTPIPTATVVVTTMPFAPITSRALGPGPGAAGSFASDALLLIDEPGSGLGTGATGGYGPEAPQSLCTSAQQVKSGGSACPAVVGVDGSGQYQVAVRPGTSTPAQNVYQGEIGDNGMNSVTFYNVPVLPPASAGVSRVFRITNLRAPALAAYVVNDLNAVVSTSPSQNFPVPGTAVNIGVAGPNTTAAVNSSPAGGGNPFNTCAAQTTPALASRITFTEGFGGSFKTRVVPGGASIGHAGSNAMWAGQAENLASPVNQNIPGGLYGGFASNSESGLILPSLTFQDPTSHVTYTAGLADFGTRLKAVFTNIPAGVTLYVSSTSTNSVAVPGGTATTPYAVLVAAGQSAEATGDGASFAPLTSTTAGSDGFFAYPLAADNTGATSAIWEVVNSNPSALDNLTFSVYVAYGSTSGTTNPTNVALSFAPEPGGGTFSTVDGTFGLDAPEPRLAIPQSMGGAFATINHCSISVSGTIPVDLTYTVGGPPPSATLQVTTTPADLVVTATASVTTPSGGHWLSAALNGGVLTISTNPAGLLSGTAYLGNVTLNAASNGQSVDIPVSLRVITPSPFTVTSSHTGNFTQGEQGATFSVVVANASATQSTAFHPTVTESLTSGLSLVSMAGTGWNCNTVPTCTRSDSLVAGGQYPAITVTVNVASNATSPQTNQATVSVPGFGDVMAIDPAVVTSTSCHVQPGAQFTIADVQAEINEALGITQGNNDLDSSGTVDVVDIQLVVNAVLSGVCVV